MDTAISIICFILIMYVIWSVEKLIDLSKKDKQRDFVSWVVLDSRYTHRSFSLYDYIHNIQIEKNIPAEYRISNKADQQIAEEILSAYQSYISEEFFRGTLPQLPKSKYVQEDEHFFMYTLGGYAELHYCDSEFLGHNMHGERTAYKEYSGDGWSATYALTDIAIVLCKLFYISSVYCQNCKAINPKGKEYWSIKSLAEIISSRKIDLSCYRH